MLRSRAIIITIQLTLALPAGGVALAQSTLANGDENPLFVDPATRDFSQNPELLERVTASAHGYFRFINIEFSQEVCRRFGDELAGTPSFNLHGDAHVEQYAVTDIGRGLTDFDDSSTGPAILDILRFGVSLSLACEARGWRDSVDVIFDRFLAAYESALRDPKVATEPPTIVERFRTKFADDRTKYFEWVNSILEPMPVAARRQLREALQPYIDAMLMQYSEHSRAFFDIVQLGYLRMGIGSALDLKYLVRVRGASDDPLDDVILEIKEVRDLSGIDCITIAQQSDPFRVLLGQARIAYRPYEYLGYITIKNRTFWIHSWVDNYREVAVGETFRSPRELYEVATDVGIQLGQGHPRQIASPLDIQLRQAQLALLKRSEAKIKEERRFLTEDALAAWQQFRKSVYAK